jgi:putative glutamine amidotransferase
VAYTDFRMSVHIAIPEPTSLDSAYNLRSLAPYLTALHSNGLIPLVIPLHERPDRVAKLLSGVHGVLLPGSRYDVDPERYGEKRIPECAAPDPGRTAADELLLQEAFSLEKPVLAICYGIQSLNVWRRGSLIQHLETTVNHSPGRTVLDAHAVRIAEGSRLDGLIREEERADAICVNSSHHQAVHVAGDGMVVSATSPEDGVIEAVELDSPTHFVVGVQWHPERTYAHSGLSRALFAAFGRAAEAWEPKHTNAEALPS